MTNTTEGHTKRLSTRETHLWLWVAVAVALVAAAALWAARAGGTVRLSPADGSTPAVTAHIALTLPPGADADAVQAAFRLDPPTAGDFVWAEGGLVFVPAAPFAPGEPVTVTVAPVEGVAGLGRAVSVTFTPRAPSVAYLAPAMGDEPAALWRASPGAAPVEIYAPERGIFDYAPAPDGERLAVTVPAEAGGTEIWLIGRDGSAPRRVTACAPLRCGAPAWSADGQLLAYEQHEIANDPGSPRHVWLLDVATGEVGPVYDSPDVEGYSPQWSARGRTLAFYDPSIRAIRVVDMLSGDTATVASEMGEVGTLAPDGSALAYADIRPVGQQFFPALWIAPVGGEGGPRPLLDAAEEDRAPRWSLDGTAIAFARRRLDRSDGFANQLWLADPITGEVRQLTGWADLNVTGFAWGPSGDELLVQRFPLSADVAAPQIGVLSVEDGTFTQVAEDAFQGQWLP